MGSVLEHVNGAAGHGHPALRARRRLRAAARLPRLRARLRRSSSPKVPWRRCSQDPAVRTAYLGQEARVSDPSPSKPPVLELEDVHAGYLQFKALFGVSFAVREAEAVALIGPNGAGKTTVARVASGLVAPTAGRVLVDGEDFTGKPADDFARAGIAHAPEGRSVFATLTVEENLTLGFRRRFGRNGVSAALEQGLRPVPPPRRAPAAGRRVAVGRRAAHAHAGRGARARTEAAHRRRALARPRAHHHRRPLRRAAAHPRRRAPRCCSSSSTSTAPWRWPTR